MNKTKEQGFMLITVILFLAIFTVLSMTLIYKITSTVKISGLAKMEMTRFYGSEGGVLSVVAYMTQYKRTDPPEDVINTTDFSVEVISLGDTVRLPIGYSTSWIGVDMQLNSKSPPPPNDKAEIELVAFIPVSPSGYGNE